MDLEKKKAFIINFLYTIIIGFILIVALRYGIFWFMPFIVGFIIAYLLKPLINFITNKFHVNRKLVSALCVLIFYGTVGILIVLLGIKIFASAKDVFYKLPEIYSMSIEPVITNLFENIEESILHIDPTMMKGLQDVAQNLSQSLGTIVTNLSTSAMSFISSVASSIPSFLIGIIFTIISSFFIAMEYYKITNFIVRQFSDKGKSILFDIKTYISGTLFKFLKAYSILITITFIELSIGLSILHINNSIAIAAIIAIVDIMPILGTGGVMIPWLIIEAVKGDYTLALGLLIVYVIITIIRNILEPKIVGNQIGLHPLVMLMCMFVGVKIFGVLGIFILPIVMIIIKNLNDNGKISVFKK